MTKARLLVVGATIALGLVVPGCEDDEIGVCEQLGGVCVGVPPEVVCDDDFCTDGVGCSEVIEVEDNSELLDAATRATAGSCIALADGSYGPVVLPGGVSLLGGGADRVQVEEIALGEGAGAVVRGMEVGRGIRLASATGARVEAVRIVGGANGVLATSGSSVELMRTTVRGAAAYGVVAFGSAVAIHESIVEDVGGPGVWAQCAGGAGCECADKPVVDMTNTVVRRAKLVGVNLRATRATLRGVDVRDITDLELKSAGGGVAASECSELDLAGMHIENTESFGLLVSGSSGKLGGIDELGIIIVNTHVGCWLEGIGSVDTNQLEIAGMQIENAYGVGLGLGFESQGIIIVNTHVGNTLAETLPLVTGASDSVGDGFLWNEGAQADIDGLEISASARHPVLIDGEVAPNSKLKSLKLFGGDESKGVLQQRASSGAMAPELDAGQSLQQVPEVVAGVPLAPQPPEAVAETQ